MKNETNKSERLEVAAGRFVDRVRAGRTEGQALADVCKAFSDVAGMIRESREAFVGFAWDMCG